MIDTTLIYPEDFSWLYNRYQAFIKERLLKEFDLSDPVASGAKSEENYGKTLPEMSKVVIFVGHGFAI